MYTLSDAAAEEEIAENIYWQYFCGWGYFAKDAQISEASIRRFRNDILGGDGYNEILKKLIRLGGKIGVDKKDLELIIVDITVQIKNIKRPHDGYLSKI